MVAFQNQNKNNIFHQIENSSTIPLPQYNSLGEKISILEIFDFEDMCEEYIIDLEIRNYSENTIKTYNSIIHSFL